MTMRASEDILRRNLSALGMRSALYARRVAATGARQDCEFFLSADGAVGVAIGPERRVLTSRREALEEGRRLASRVDVCEHGAVAIAGFGAGHHVRAVAERMGEHGVVIVLEPDVALMRAVLERIDCSEWMGRTNLVMVEDAGDASGVSGQLEGLQALVSLGLELVEHPASRARLGADCARFGETMTGVVRALRTTVTTTLVQSPTTLRNALMNLDRYATCGGIEPLRGVCAGRPAILVAAGPSLEHAMETLATEAVRERFVVIAVQTVLKPLIERGIRPHYVTALDHHEISRRFYEGLSAEDVRGVTLVAEPKVNPAVLEAFPGEVRLSSDERLDRVLGMGLARAMGRVEPGATVAHLSYFLARFLGCDPVILVGQDLGFSDGQYYADGAAIHGTWACELGEFRSLEMFEHERIVRQRHLLTRTIDRRGRAIYTDEQMHSYLVQFEEMFARDAATGLTIIDATEGGVRKRHTACMGLDEAIGACAPGSAWAPPAGGALGGRERATRLEHVGARVRSLLGDARRVASLSRETGSALRRMGECQRDQREVGRLIERVHGLRDEVLELDDAWTLTRFLNQAGELNRIRADRALALGGPVSAMERQARQIARDEKNVAWVADAADELSSLFESTLVMLSGGARLTRDRATREGGPVRVARERRIAAIVPIAGRSGLGGARDLARPLAMGRNALEWTLHRLAMCERVSAAMLLTDEPERVRSLIGGAPEGMDVQIVHTERAPMRDRWAAVASARLWSDASWRGGLGAMTVWDEVFDPEVIASVMEDLGLEAGALVGPDWALLDPALADACVERHVENPEGAALVFSQAAPGLSPCVLGRGLVRDLAERSRSQPQLSTLGALLGYVPGAGRADPIARSGCVQTEVGLRDLMARVVPDSPTRFAAIGGVLGDGGDALRGAGLAGALRGLMALDLAGSPRLITLELCTGRLTSGRRAVWAGVGEAQERGPMALALARSIIEQLAEARPDIALTLGGAGDPLNHPDVAEIVGIARRSGIAGVHVRTDLLADASCVDAVVEAGVDVISVDVGAGGRETYREINGIDAYERVESSLESLISLRNRGAVPGGLARPWIAARIARCESVLGDIEGFYDRWLASAGACLIDPLSRRMAGERITPRSLPSAVRARRAVEGATIRANGAITVGSHASGDLREEALAEVLRRARGKTLARSVAAIAA